jgi:nucleoside-diphosphate-sugar epimerase
MTMSPTTSMPENEEMLEDRLSAPTPEAVEAMGELEGDVTILGVGGKMGPSLARMARRASEMAGRPRRIYGVSRFSDGGAMDALARDGIEPLRCDLLDAEAVGRLPDAPNVLYMTGQKFGGRSDPSRMWAMNTVAPTLVCRRFEGCRWLAFSTGNVYPLTPVVSGGPEESATPQPVGEYGMSCLGRERVFEYFSRTQRAPLSLVRLNYATDLRYGVLVDLAQKVWSGQPVDLAMGHFNIIWQGDANAMALAALARASVPPVVFNVAGPEILSVRSVSEAFGGIMGKPAIFSGVESDTALLNNAARSRRELGEPRVSADELIRWTARWIMEGRRTLGKPTHFEARDGVF